MPYRFSNNHKNCAREWYKTLSSYLHEAKYKRREKLPQTFYSSLHYGKYMNVINWNKF